MNGRAVHSNLHPSRATKTRLLHELRAHPGFRDVVNCLVVDRDEWRHCEQTGQEDYPGEARERREARDLLLSLLGEAP